MLKLRQLVVAVLSAAVLLPFDLAAEEFRQATVGYSADSLMSVPGMGSVTGKVYGAPGGLERREQSFQGMRMVTISRPDLGKVWTLMPDARMYMEGTMNQAGPGGRIEVDENTEVTRLGTETVNGHETTKYRIVNDSPEGTFDGLAWVTEHWIMVRMEGNVSDNKSGRTMQMTMELKNLAIGDQDDGLFEVPAGYQAMPSMPGGGMPGMPSQ